MCFSLNLIYFSIHYLLPVILSLPSHCIIAYFVCVKRIAIRLINAVACKWQPAAWNCLMICLQYQDLFNIFDCVVFACACGLLCL